MGAFVRHIRTKATRHTEAITDGVEIRKGVAADAAAIARLLHDFNTEFSEPTPGVDWLTERLGALLESGEVVVLLAGGSGDAIGSPLGLAVMRLRRGLWDEGAEAYLQELYVVPARRGEGIGRALLEATMTTARAAGATTLDLNTSTDDPAAIGLYESAGFTNREGSPDGPSMLFYEREL
ncbi:MAG TPA: GNAT family N-acetyltransferase [Solirubrobacterales bacterium]|nr:GNAT family N-acetyltransferase [Solirubrobacterales bacterium]